MSLTQKKISYRLGFSALLVLMCSIVFGISTANQANAATTVYERVNNQTIKYYTKNYVSVGPTTSNPLTANTSPTVYYHADTPQNEDNGDPMNPNGDTFFWSVKTGSPTICEQYIVKNNRASPSIWQEFTAAKIDTACAARTLTQVEVPNFDDTGKDIFFYKDSATNIIHPADKTASDSEFRLIKNTSNLGLSGDQAIYVQTKPASTCPALLVAYKSDSWGFVAPISNQSAQSGADHDFYKQILTNAGDPNIDPSKTGGCDVGSNQNAIHQNNEKALVTILGGTTDFWKTGLYSGYHPFLALQSVVKPLGNAVGTESAAEIRLNTAPANSNSDLVGSSGASPNTPGTSSCTVDGIGWIVCPVVNFLAGIATGAFSFLADNFLKTNTAIFDTSAPTYVAWSAMRNIANIAFVVVFLIIIFSQLTSVGITNYGVKKMLPRLIIAAILVNISYFICQIAVDLSNVLGYSLKDFFAVIGNTAVPAGTSQAATGTGFIGAAGTILAFAGAVAIGYALLSTLIPVLLAAVVALIMIMFILVARQALIIILIVISPIAFVAYLLPNTEQWFKKWQKTFIAMLMLFPIVALIFGGSSLASTILANTFNGSFSGDQSAEANKMFGQVIAMAVGVLPLFIVPGLLKKALDGVGGIGAKINGIGGKLGGALGAKGKESYSQGALARGRELKKQGKQEFRNRKFNDAMAGGEGAGQRVRRALGRGGRPLTESGVFARNRATQAAAGASASAENKDYNEAVAAAAAQQRNSTVAEVANMAATGMHNGQAITEHERAAAIDRTMSSGGFSQRRAVLEGLASDKAGTSRDLRSRAITGAYSKGDQNIFGVAFGDQILDEGGTINGAADLAAATVQNAADGHVQAEHLVQGSSATEYLVNSTLASADPYARNNLRNAATTLHATPSLQGKSDSVIDTSLGTL